MQVRYLVNSRGVSLIEVLVAMIILAIGLLGLAPFMIVSIEANSASKNAAIASLIARDKIESLEAQPLLPTFATSEVETNVRAGYDRTTVISTHASDSTIPEGLVRATINVSWIDDLGVNRQTTVSTFLRGQ